MVIVATQLMDFITATMGSFIDLFSQAFVASLLIPFFSFIATALADAVG